MRFWIAVLLIASLAVAAGKQQQLSEKQENEQLREKANLLLEKVAEVSAQQPQHKEETVRSKPRRRAYRRRSSRRRPRRGGRDRRRRYRRYSRRRRRYYYEQEEREPQDTKMQDILGQIAKVKGEEKEEKGEEALERGEEPETPQDKINLELELKEDSQDYRMGYFLTQEALSKVITLGQNMLTGGPKTKMDLLQAFKALRLKGEVRPCIQGRAVSKGKYQRGLALYCV